LRENVISYLLDRPRDHPAAMPGILHAPCQVMKMAENCEIFRRVARTAG
jgi:hypothetical protein